MSKFDYDLTNYSNLQEFFKSELDNFKYLSVSYGNPNSKISVLSANRERVKIQSTRGKTVCEALELLPNNITRLNHQYLGLTESYDARVNTSVLDITIDISTYLNDTFKYATTENFIDYMKSLVAFRNMLNDDTDEALKDADNTVDSYENDSVAVSDNADESDKANVDDEFDLNDLPDLIEPPEEDDSNDNEDKESTQLGTPSNDDVEDDLDNTNENSDTLPTVTAADKEPVATEKPKDTKGSEDSEEPKDTSVTPDANDELDDLENTNVTADSDDSNVPQPSDKDNKEDAPESQLTKKPESPITIVPDKNKSDDSLSELEDEHVLAPDTSGDTSDASDTIAEAVNDVSNQVDASKATTEKPASADDKLDEIAQLLKQFVKQDSKSTANKNPLKEFQKGQDESLANMLKSLK